jgi:hypothetical protein
MKPMQNLVEPITSDPKGPTAQFSDRQWSQALALVTQTLLVTIGAHALLALVLVDLCFSALFERTHGGYSPVSG